MIKTAVTDSAFAKIVAGEIPAYKLYENDTTLAFLDINPQHEGHTLVIPKKQPAEFVWDLSDDQYLELAKTIKKVALRLRQVLPYPFIHQAIVGTDVPYAHVHLIPFTVTADLHSAHDTGEPDHQALAELAQKLYFED